METSDRPSRPPMKTVVIGGGRAAKAVLELVAARRLRDFELEILCVVDPDPEAPGSRYADEHWWPTLDDIDEALALPGLELVVELTGDDQVAAALYRHVRPGVKVLDHTMARLFFDLYTFDRALAREVKAKEALQRQVEDERRQLQSILDSLSDVVLVVDRDLNIVWANRRFGAVSGTDPLSARGQACHDLFCKRPPPNLIDDPSCPCLRVLKTGKPVEQTTRRVVDEFDARHYQITATPIFDDAGQVVQVVESSRDITKLVKLQQETARSERLFRQFIDAAQEFIWIKDPDGHYTVVNQAAAGFFGETPERILGRRDEDFLPPEVADTFTAGYREVLASKTHLCFTEEVELQGKDHTLLTCRFPLLDHQERVVGICTIARDVTEEKRLARQLLDAERLGAVGRAVGGLAHDIKNILNGFQGGEYVLEYGVERNDLEDIQKGTRIIKRNIDRISTMVQNMLAYAKGRRPAPRLVKPQQEIRELAETLAARYEPEDVRIVAEVDEEEREVRVDFDMIHRVLVNLASNAVDACNEKLYPEGERPEVRLRARFDGAGDLVVEVSDNGAGMPAKVKQNLFRQFFSTKGSRGTGFGLPVSYKLVQEMGGRFEVDSVFGEGTTMRVIVPAQAAEGNG